MCSATGLLRRRGDQNRGRLPNFSVIHNDGSSQPALFGRVLKAGAAALIEPRGLGIFSLVARMIRAAKEPAQPTRPDYSDPIRGPDHLAVFAGNAAASYQGSKFRRIVSRLRRLNQLRPVALGDDAPQNPALAAV